MLKRSWWIFLVMAVGGILLWLALGGIEPGKKRAGAASNPASSADRPVAPVSGSSSEPLHLKAARESPRYSSGEIKRHQAEQTRLARLKEVVRNQEEKVEERRKVLATIIRTKGIIYRGNGLTDSTTDEREVDLKSTLETYNQLDQARMQLGSQIASLLRYENEQLMVYAAGLELPDNPVKVLYPKYQEAKRTSDSLKASGRGEDDPEMLAQSEQLTALKSQIDDGVTNLRATLQAQVVMSEEQLKQIETIRAREIKDQREITTQDYVDAKRDFETDQKLLQEMRLKLITAQMEAKAR